MFSTSTLKHCDPQALRRLCQWLKVRNLDAMSDRQMIRFLRWLYTRREKRQRGWIY